MTRKIFRRRQIICMRGLEYTISGFGKFLIVIAVSILGISLYRKNVIKREKKQLI